MDIVLNPINGRYKQTVLNSTPVDHGYDTMLWTRAILVELLHKHFGICVSEATVGLHLHQLNLSCQTPRYRAVEQDPVQVERFLKVTFPQIQRLAQKMGADIGFEDEAGVKIMTRSGRTEGRWDSHRRWWSATTEAVLTCYRSSRRTGTYVTR